MEFFVFSDDSKREILIKSTDADSNSADNNNLYTSTPLKTTNGNISDVSLDASDGIYTKMDDEEDFTPIEAKAKEQLMNSINAHSNSSFIASNAHSISRNLNSNSFAIKSDNPDSFSVNSVNTNGVNSVDKNTIGFNGLNSNSSFNTHSSSFNSVNTSIGSNITTIIAEIEGEVKKKPRHYVDKTYYIAKEILMTELTYKKDLDVIHVVSEFFCINGDLKSLYKVKYG